MSKDKMNVGIVGAAGRGAGFVGACRASGFFEIHAVCDTNQAALGECAERLGAREKYSDYGEMIEKSDLGAVIIGTPMNFHIPQALEAIKRGVHVLSEVPAGVSIEECRALVLACKSSKAIYMMAENYTYMLPNVVVREMVKHGLFGEPYYAEGEYLHELKELNEITVWRRKWQTGINGVTYCTHSLGPILQWMPGDRVVMVCCAGSGHHYKDPRGNYYENEDSCVMLCKMAKGGLVKIRLDMLSERPHAMTNYSLQGTGGAYESSRGGPGEINKVWIKSRSRQSWQNLEEYEEEFLPAYWKEATEQAKTAGHGGGDFFEILDFADAVRRKRPCPIGIHEAMDMTLPGLVSQQSIMQKGKWLPVPDSRDW